MLYKKAMRSPDFLATRGWANAYRNINDMRYFIGHNRKATQGAAHLDWNAHPFHQGNIILAHNGSLRNEYTLEPTWRTICDTDSELLAYLLNKQSPEELIPKINGAFALTWHDARDNSLNIIRNDERPLHLATIKGKNTLVWASELGMLKYVLARNGVELDGNIEVLNEGWHIKIKDDVRKYESTEIALYKAPVTNYNSKRTHPYDYEEYNQYPRDRANTNINVRANSRAKEQNRLLAKYHLSPNQWVKFRYLSFDKYSTIGVNSGSLQGMAYGNRSLENCYVQANNFDPTKLDMEYCLRGKVSRIEQYTGDTHPTIFLKDVQEIKTAPDPGAKKSYLQDIGVKSGALVVLDRPDGTIPVSNVDEIKKIAGKHVSPGVKDKYRIYRGPDGKFFRLKDFRKLVSDGCVHCTGNIVCNDADNILWTKDNRPVCPECVSKNNAGEIDLRGYIQQ